jgi:uncharacterized protein YjeT (DUF2065 family)
VTDFIVAIGLVFVIEGVVATMFPNMTRAAMQAAAQVPPHRLRIAGLAAAVFGVALVWLVRG